MKKNVPNERFPFITCYARLLDIRNLKPITQYEDALIDKNWNLGNIKYKKGISQYVLELDIWNNEPDVSGGFTQRIFNDAQNCNIKIFTKNKNQDLSFKIRNVVNYKDDFIDYNNTPFIINGNVTKNNGVLKGNGDHCIIQIFVELNNEIENDDISELDFIVCFNYECDNENVNLFFNCNISLDRTKSKVTIENTINNGQIFIGNLSGINCKGTLIEAISNGKLQDQLILSNDKYYLFLTDGIYNINIKNPSINRKFSNIKVTNGITPQYNQILDGLIYKQYDDVFEYYNDNYSIKEIIGILVDEYKNPICNAEIIITQQDNLIVYYVTDKDGYYRFQLENGIYDIRIRSNNKRLKIIRNFKFKSNMGFFSSIKDQYKIFEQDFNFSKL